MTSDISRCIDTIENAYAFQCEAGLLENCGEWKYLKHLVAALASSEPQSPPVSAGWQPIDTAPKSRFIIVYCPEDNSRWLAKWQSGHWYGCDVDHGLLREGMGPEDVTGWKVTLWTDAPAPPAHTSQERKP